MRKIKNKFKPFLNTLPIVSEIAVFLAIIGFVLGFVLGFLTFTKKDLVLYVLSLSFGLGVLAFFAARIWSINKYLIIREVTVRFPAGDAVYSVQPYTDERKLAWKIFVEITTRISIQPLAANEGILDESLSSLYYLFSCVRNLIAEAPPEVDIFSKRNTPCVQVAAVEMLNLHLRPFLSKWHKEYEMFKKSNEFNQHGEDAWPQCENFRRDLEILRLNLKSFSHVFGNAAQVYNIDDYLKSKYDGKC